MTRIHLTTAWTISSLLNCLMLSISSLTSLRSTKHTCSRLKGNMRVLEASRLVT